MPTSGYGTGYDRPLADEAGLAQSGQRRHVRHPSGEKQCLDEDAYRRDGDADDYHDRGREICEAGRERAGTPD